MNSTLLACLLLQRQAMPADIAAYCYAAVVAAGGIMGFTRAGKSDISIHYLDDIT